jgi:predicted ATPase
LDEFEWPGSERLRVRIGIHSGEASEEATGLVGYEVHRAARIAAVGHGGQILLSSATAGLVDDSLPEESTLRNLGPHRLKDLGRPVVIFQLIAAGLTLDFSPLRSLDNPELPNNLPASLGTFIGRVSELREVRTLIENSRLVTLTGAGGSGKTRLALQAAADFLDGNEEGVWLVEMAPIIDPNRVVETIIETLLIRHEPGLAPKENLLRVLRDQRLLIILDNCEHLVDSVAKLVDSILRSCHSVHLVVTSREPLGIDDEDVYRVRSLSLPLGEVETVDDVLGSDSVELFVTRTRQQDKTFELTDLNVALVASICRRLDGSPLAIELAAARLSSMSVEDLHDRLDHRFRLLSGGHRSALPRQQTLSAMVAWSYDLLNDFERVVLRRLTVFVNGFNLHAAELVCSTDTVESSEVSNIIGSLVAKSLVVAERSDASVRYRLLETIRQFAAERLVEDDGETAMGEARRRHADCFLELCETAEPYLRGGPDQALWINRLEDEWGNIQAAFNEFSNNPNGAEEILRLGVSGDRFFEVRAHREAAVAVGEALETASDVEPTLRSRALVLWAESLGQEIQSADVAEETLREMQALYCEALGLARSSGDVDTLVLVLSRMSFWLNDAGALEEARNLAEEAVGVARGSGDSRLIGIALMYEGFTKKIDDRKSRLLEAASWLRRAGDSASLCMALLAASVRNSVSNDDFREDQALNAEALQLAEEVGHVDVTTLLIGNLGCYCFYLGEITEAASHLRRTVRTIHRAGLPEYWLSGYAWVLACVVANEGDYLASALMMGADARLHSEAPEFFVQNRESRKSELDIAIGEDVRRRSIESLGEETYERALRAGEGLTTSQLIDLALGRLSAKI